MVLSNSKNSNIKEFPVFFIQKMILQKVIQQTAFLYARVSTEEQATRGGSFRYTTTTGFIYALG
jgi:hypothetical protein